jgi:hypothetical protein
VAWKVWLNTPAPAEFPVVGANPLIVKKLAETFVSEYPVIGVTVTCAVYEVLSAKVEGEPDQLICVVYWPLLLIEVCGVAPKIGGVTTTFDVVMFALLVTLTVYVFVVLPSSAVTTTLITFEPRFSEIAPEALPDVTGVPFTVIEALV